MSETISWILQRMRDIARAQRKLRGDRGKPDDLDEEGRLQRQMVRGPTRVDTRRGQVAGPTGDSVAVRPPERPVPPLRTIVHPAPAFTERTIPRPVPKDSEPSPLRTLIARVTRPPASAREEVAPKPARAAVVPPERPSPRPRPEVAKASVMESLGRLLAKPPASSKSKPVAAAPPDLSTLRPKVSSTSQGPMRSVAPTVPPLKERKAKKEKPVAKVATWVHPTAPTTMQHSQVTIEEVMAMGGPQAGVHLQELIFDVPVRKGVQADGRYIPYNGGLLGWFENSGVIEVEQPNNYQLFTVVDGDQVRAVQLERFADKTHLKTAEKRRTVRTELNPDAKVTLIVGKHSLAAKCEDFSPKGMRLLVMDEKGLFNKEERARIQIRDKTGRNVLLDLTGPVAWAKETDEVRKTFVFGVTFGKLTKEEMYQVKDLTVRNRRGLVPGGA